MGNAKGVSNNRSEENLNESLTELRMTNYELTFIRTSLFIIRPFTPPPPGSNFRNTQFPCNPENRESRTHEGKVHPHENELWCFYTALPYSPLLSPYCCALPLAVSLPALSLLAVSLSNPSNGSNGSNPRTCTGVAKVSKDSAAPAAHGVGNSDTTSAAANSIAYKTAIPAARCGTRWCIHACNCLRARSQSPPSKSLPKLLRYAPATLPAFW